MSSTARTLIDRIVEEQEHAIVKVELTGSPQAIQRGLKYLAKTKGGLKKAVDGGAKVSVTEPKAPGKDDDKAPKKAPAANGKDDGEDGDDDKE